MSEAQAGPGGIEEWRQGSFLVVASTAAFTTCLLHSYSLGVMIGPLEAEFGWTRAQVTSGMMVSSVMALFMAPIGGMLVDRWGPRRIGLIGIFAYLGGLSLFSLAGPALWSWLAVWIVMALCTTFTKPGTWSTAVSSRFVRQRGLAIAVLFCASGIANSTVPVLTQTLLQYLDWRMTYLALAGIGLVIASPLLWFFFYDAHAKPLRMPGAEPSRQSAAPTVYAGLEVREALLSSRFVRLALTGALMAGLTVGTNVHFVSILIEAGFSRMGAAATTSFLGMGAIAGHILIGVLLDRYSGPKIGGLAFLIPIPGYFMLANLDGTAPAAAMAAICIGFGAGSQSGVLAYLSTRYFGLKKFGTIYGMIIGITTTGAAWPALIGHLYDTTGTYQGYLQIAGPIYLVCALMVLTLGAYPEFQRREAVLA
ncbi:MAG: MFS transporter [Novosphingobium sp.]|nr:MFS transporter [Novosphingobium sp.]